MSYEQIVQFGINLHEIWFLIWPSLRYISLEMKLEKYLIIIFLWNEFDDLKTNNMWFY